MAKTTATATETIALISQLTESVMSPGYMDRVRHDMEQHEWELRPCEYGSEERALYRDGKLSGVLAPEYGGYEMVLSNEAEMAIFC